VKVNLGPADVSFELWHNGVKLSKDNSIKVEWQAAAAPPTMTAADEVVTDFPMSSLPAAHRQSLRNGANRLTQGTMMYAQPPVQSSLHVNGAGGNMNGGGRWDYKSGVHTHTAPIHQNGSTVW
jgi:hypothetical protein